MFNGQSSTPEVSALTNFTQQDGARGRQVKLFVVAPQLRAYGAIAVRDLLHQFRNGVDLFYVQ
jgi:hypothetical protein